MVMPVLRGIVMICGRVEDKIIDHWNKGCHRAERPLCWLLVYGYWNHEDLWQLC